MGDENNEVQKTKTEKQPPVCPHGTFQSGVAVQERVGRDHAGPPRVARHLGPHQVPDIVLQQLAFVSAAIRTGFSLSWNLKMNMRYIEYLALNPASYPQKTKGESDQGSHTHMCTHTPKQKCAFPHGSLTVFR